jgi:hypothetical protein
MEEKNDDVEDDDEIIKIILHPDSEIITSDGTVKKVSDVEENDVLLGSSHCNVVFKKYLSETNFYRIIPRYGNSFLISDHNQFIVFNHVTLQYDLMDVNLFRALDNYQKLHISIKKSFIDYFEIDVYIDPYFIGLFIANNEFSLRLNYNDDISIKNRIKESINKLKLGYFTDNYTKSIIVSKIFIDEKISDEYYDFLVEKNIPEIYIKNSLDIRRQLLAGIIDVNSEKHSNYIEITNLTQKMANFIYSLCFSINLHHIHLIIKGKNIYNIKIFDDLNDIPLLIKKDYLNKINSYPYNNFKIAPVFQKDCVVLLFKEASSIILSDFSMI